MSPDRTRQEKSAGRFNVLPAVFSVLIGLIVSILLLALFSLIFTVQDLPQGAVVPLACISIAGGSLVGGFLAARTYGNKGLAFGAITGLLFFVVLYVIGIIMRQIGIGPEAFLKLIISVTAGCIGGITGVNTGRRKQRI